MAVTGPGRQPSHDWALLLSQFEAEYVPHKITLRQFCKERGISEKLCSDAFNRERKRTALGVFHDRNKPLLLVAQRRVQEALARISVEADPIKAGRFALEVYEKVAEREEPNPLLTQQLNVVMPPLFPPSALAARAIEALTGKPAPKTIEAKAVK